jgi:hypothetical protein
VSKVHPRTGHEGPQGENSNTSTLLLTSALDGGVAGQPHAPAALPLGRIHSIAIVQEDGRAPGPVLTGVENLAPPMEFEPVASRTV